MKCFILKTQDDLSNELYESDSPHCHCRGRVSSWGRARPEGAPRLRGPWQAGLPASLAERPVDTVPEAAFAGFLHCMRFGNECKTVPWAFTFCASLASEAGTFCWPAREEPARTCLRGRDAGAEWRGVTGGQVRGLAPAGKRSCLRASTDPARSGDIRARKTGWKQTALSRVPWWEDQCKS